MEGIIKVDTAKLTSTAASFQTASNSVRSLTNAMTETVNGLNGQVWSGDAATKYTTQFSGLQDDINKMIAMINEHVTDLGEMASKYEQAEATNTTSASGLSSNVIS